MEALKVTWLMVSFTCQWIWLWYIINRVMRHFVPWVGALNKEMWWIFCYIAAPITNLSFYTSGVDWWDYLFGPINLWIWWDIWKHDDHDDRWKKRRKKAANKVKQVAGKLIVVPHPQPT